MKGFTQTVLFLGVAATMYGKLCVADCGTDPKCSGQGTCELDETCTCNDGYIGDLCEQDDPCLPDPCNGQGTCAPDTSIPPGDVCTCEAGYGGDKCDLVSCTINPCQNGGTCEVEAGSIVCASPKCTDATVCENGGTCKADTTGQHICFCAPGFGGDLCADASGAATISGHFLLLTAVAILAKLNLN